jgi:hypothetical protein
VAQRGRKSAASRSILPFVTPPRLPPPPPEFSAEEAAIWDSVVGSMSREWFASAGTHVLLPTFCFAAAVADKLAAELRQVTDIDADPDRLATLVGMYARQTAVLARLAGKMRLMPPRGHGAC